MSRNNIKKEKEIISERSDIAFKSTATKNQDLIDNTIISKELSKKNNSDKKSNSSKKIISEKSISKKLKKSEDSIYNLENLENDIDFSTRQEKKKSTKKKKEKTLQKIIVDDIENIYISLIGKFSSKLLTQTIIVLMISFGVNE